MRIPGYGNSKPKTPGGGENLHLCEVHSDFVVHIEISEDGDVDVYVLPS